MPLFYIYNFYFKNLIYKWIKQFENCKDTIRNEPNCVGFAREKAQTMSFVERGFERLGSDHQVMGFSRYSYKVK